jgi:hypothetical protein
LINNNNVSFKSNKPKLCFNNLVKGEEKIFQKYINCFYIKFNTLMHEKHKKGFSKLYSSYQKYRFFLDILKEH